MNARQEWLTARRSGIGGSDVAAILGLSKWKTPYSVWQDKIGQGIEIEDNAPMKWGRALEPVIRQEYAEATGRIVLQPTDMLRHPKHEFMLANLDGMTEDRRVVEIKTARSSQGWGEPGSDQVPQDYMFQVQHYMAVTGFEVADVAVLIGGSDFRLYEVPADTELQEMMIDAEANFWNRVITNTPPEPVSLADAQARYGRSLAAGAIEANKLAADALATYQTINNMISDLQAQADDAKAKIMAYMGEHESLIVGGKPVITWKTQAGAKRFDTAEFKAAHPDVYPMYLKQGEPSRRFLVK